MLCGRDFTLPIYIVCLRLTLHDKDNFLFLIIKIHGHSTLCPYATHYSRSLRTNTKLPLRALNNERELYSLTNMKTVYRFSNIDNNCFFNTGMSSCSNLPLSLTGSLINQNLIFICSFLGKRQQ